jgi:PAS domain S-box-containing protein
MPLPYDQRSLIESLDLLPIAMVVSNPRLPDNPLEVVNSAFCALTGYAEAEILGRNCRFLTGEGTDPGTSELLRESIRACRPTLVDILNYRSDGRPFRNGVMITPLYGAGGDVEYFLGSQVDLGAAPEASFLDRRSQALAKVADLPPRQRQVLAEMAKGLLNKQIAWELKISEKTVKMHRGLLIERLGVSSSAEAIRIAVEAGF